MTLLVAGILLGLGVPNVMEFQRSGAQTAAANDLLTGILVARTEALRRQVPVALCLTLDATAATPTCAPNAVADSDTLGFFVWVDENGDTDALGNPDIADPTDGNAVVDPGETIVLMRNVARGLPTRLSANCGNVTFGANGWIRQTGTPCRATPNQAQFFTYCDNRGRRATSGNLSSARAIRVDATGRGVVLQETAQVNAALGVTLAAMCP